MNGELLDDSEDSSPPLIPSSGRPDRRRAILVSDDEDEITIDSTTGKPPSHVAEEDHVEDDEDLLEDEDDVRSPISRKLSRRRDTAIQTLDPDVDERRELADDVEDLESNGRSSSFQSALFFTKCT